MMRYKGIFPYSYIDSYEKLHETQLPTKREFFNDLTKEHISDVEYERAKSVWKHFNINSLKEYSDKYLLCDVLILTDIFENFRNICLKYYELDPAHYLTAPSLSWDAMLKKTGIKLDLLNDLDMIHFLRKGIRGGLCQCSIRKVKANNQFMRNYNPSQKKSYLIYLDVKNLYGHCMSQNLPYGGFKWTSNDNFDVEKILNLKDDSEMGYIFEVDLKYPEHLHDNDNDLPFCPHSFIPPNSKLPKLCATLLNKTEYVVDYKTLRQALSHGLILTKIHRVLEYKQSYWLKSYVDLNSNLREQAKTAFEKDFFKLMVNSIYGKSLEAVHKHKTVKLVTKWEGVGGAENLTSNPYYHNFSIFNDNFAAIQMKKSKIFYNKPLYVGFCILELAKYHMYDFYYNYLKREYGDNIRCIYTDTDSLIILVYCDNFYEDLKSFYPKYDTSNYPINNIHNIQRTESIIGKMKDEFGGLILTEFLGTGAKAYCVELENDLIIKKAKGVRKHVIENELSKDDYDNIVQNNIPHIFRGMGTFRSFKHEIYSMYTNKVSLNYFDDKRILLSSSYETLAWGHKNALQIVTQTT